MKVHAVAKVRLDADGRVTGVEWGPVDTVTNEWHTEPQVADVADVARHDADAALPHRRVRQRLEDGEPRRPADARARDPRHAAHLGATWRAAAVALAVAAIVPGVGAAPAPIPAQFDDAASSSAHCANRRAWSWRARASTASRHGSRQANGAADDNRRHGARLRLALVASLAATPGALEALREAFVGALARVDEFGRGGPRTARRRRGDRARCRRARSDSAGATMSANAAPLLVVCLCADWCGSCREYRSAFEALRERYGGSAELAWIDVEDESEALGDPDIENFPTLLVAAGDVALFYGAVTPPSAERLVAGAIDGSLAPAADSDADALVARVRRLLAGGADAA